MINVLVLRGQSISYFNFQHRKNTYIFSQETYYIDIIISRDFNETKNSIPSIIRSLLPELQTLKNYY